mmetsp:Transcript_67435/g.140909  ORF Transcript_67435/g.140909 Transcript_67435/m.140909 type:complete len:106 (-) Transcript_67435:1985-2302(-)
MEEESDLKHHEKSRTMHNRHGSQLHHLPRAPLGKYKMKESEFEGPGSANPAATLDVAGRTKKVGGRKCDACTNTKALARSAKCQNRENTTKVVGDIEAAGLASAR